jgi:hypothetical protein
MVELAKQGEAAQLICEVGWRPGGTFRKPISREAYTRDLGYAEALAFPVHEWRGEDRDGKPLVVSWITTGVGGALLSAYEIQGRA